MDHGLAQVKRVKCMCVFDRFMVFFDDGYAQYSAANMLHQVYDQSKPLLLISCTTALVFCQISK